MPVQVQQEQIDHCRVALTIDVPPEEIQKAVDSVFNQFAKRTSVPGVRPGKAPRNLVRRFIDEGRVQELAVERALTNAFRDAIKQTGVEPYGEAEPQVERPEEELDPEKGFSFKATIALRPHVHLGELEGLTGRRVLTQITDEDVTREIDRYREAASTYQPTDQPAVDEDRLRATTEVSIEGEPVESLTFREPRLFQVGSNLEEFDAGLRGLSAGEQKTFEFTFPADLDDEELRGKTATAQVAVTEVLRATAPELDEEFARKVGAESVENLRTRIREGLQRQADLLADQELNEGLLREIVRRSEVHFPEEMVAREVTDRVNSLIAALQKRGYTLEDYLEAQETDLQTYQGRTRQEAEESIRNTLVLLEIAQANNIRVTDQDVEQEVRQRAEAENVKLSQMRRLLADTGEFDAIRNRVFRRKVAEFLRGKAEIREVQA